MTALARNAEHVIRTTIAIHHPGVSHDLKRRRVAFETTRQHRTAEVERTIAVAGTVDPGVQRGPVRHRQLKQLIVLAPVKISLSFAAGTDDVVEALRKRNCVWRRAEDASLEEAVVAGFEAIGEFGFGGLENVVKFAEDRFFRSDA